MDIKIKNKKIARSLQIEIEALIGFNKEKTGQTKDYLHRERFWNEIVFYINDVFPSVKANLSNSSGRKKLNVAAQSVLSDLKGTLNKIKNYQNQPDKYTALNSAEWRVIDKLEAYKKDGIEHNLTTGENNIPSDFLYWGDLYPGAMQFLLDRYIDAIQENLKDINQTHERESSNKKQDIHILTATLRLWRKYSHKTPKVGQTTQFYCFCGHFYGLLQEKCPSHTTIKKYLLDI